MTKFKQSARVQRKSGARGYMAFWETVTVNLFGRLGGCVRNKGNDKRLPAGVSHTCNVLHISLHAAVL